MGGREDDWVDGGWMCGWVEGREEGRKGEERRTRRKAQKLETAGPLRRTESAPADRFGTRIQTPSQLTFPTESLCLSS